MGRAKGSSRNVRHDQPVRHARLEMLEDAGLSSRHADRQVWPWIPPTPIDTREETDDNSLVIFERGQNIVVENRRGGRSAPTTVNSSVRTREYLTAREIERLMDAARKSSRWGHR